MERIKQSLSRAAKAAHQVACSRRFAAALLAVATVAMSVTVSVNSRAITVTDGDESHVVLTMHDDPYKVLDTAGVVLEEHDSIDVDSASAIDVNRAMAIEVQADGLSTLLHLTEGTVADALERAGITLGKADKISHTTATPLEDGMEIIVSGASLQQEPEPEPPTEPEVTEPEPEAPTVDHSGKTIVSIDVYEDCDGSGHGIKIITYSDGTQEEVLF